MKAPLDLLPFDALISVADVLRHGAAKYGARNWERGMSWSRVFAAALRHMFSYWAGEHIDKDSGLPHIALAATEVLFLLAYSLRRAGTDDRPISPSRYDPNTYDVTSLRGE